MKVEVKGYVVSNDDKEVYDYFGIGTTCPADISAAIEQAAGKPLDVEISTCYGGDIFAGSEIYSVLKGYAGGANITITGLAASAASIIAMAGPSEMSPTAMMMVHHVASGAQGNYHVMDKSSVMLQQADKAMAAAYTTKSGMSEADALTMMDNETWLTAQQAAEKKLIDKVMFADDAQLVAAYGGAMLPRAVIEKTRNILHPTPTDTTDIDTLKAKLALQLSL